jgi:hypothetical protein
VACGSFSSTLTSRGRTRWRSRSILTYSNGEAPEETRLQLLSIAARTCYLHAASKTATKPNLRIIHNGRDIACAA